MSPNPPPEATPLAALARLAAVRPAEYARTRNRLDGAVTGLAPYLTHGLLTLPQVLAHLQRAHRLTAAHKLVFELGWRAFFRHVWRHEGEGILQSLHPGPLPEAAYAAELPADVRQARTGLAVVDEAVRTLHATGTLHNHARMWLASYLVHGRKVHWRAGADWMLGHLLDGDLASNHLSWQWVAGTGSSKPYLFNAENVRRHAPPHWHVDGSALDTGYDALHALAYDAGAVLGPGRGAPPGQPPAGEEPPLHAAPPDWAQFGAPDPAAIAGRGVWLVHPWCLRDPPPGLLAVAVVDTGFHARWPWSARRWRFVAGRMGELAPGPGLRWAAPAAALRRALAAAGSVQGLADPHLALAGGLLDPGLPGHGGALPLQPEPAVWPEPGRRLRSFSAWWSKVAPRTPQLAGDAAAAAAQGELFGGAAGRG